MLTNDLLQMHRQGAAVRSIEAQRLPGSLQCLAPRLFAHGMTVEHKLHHVRVVFIGDVVHVVAGNDPDQLPDFGSISLVIA